MDGIIEGIRNEEEKKIVKACLMEFLDQGDWKKKQEILEYLYDRGIDINERTLRVLIQEFNESNRIGDTELFIAHGNLGYLLTRDPMWIKRSLRDDKKRAMTLLKRVYGCEKRLGERTQLKLNIEGVMVDTNLLDIIRAFEQDG